MDRENKIGAAFTLDRQLEAAFKTSSKK